MVRIRLRRMGSKHKPSYRVVIADARAPRDGKFIETIGHYNPQQQPKVLVIKQDRARYWLSVGAQPSDTVTRLLKNVGVYDADGKLAPETEAPAAPVAEAPAKRVRRKSTGGAAAAPAPAAVAETAPAAAEESTPAAVAETAPAAAEETAVEETAEA